MTRDQDDPLLLQARAALKAGADLDWRTLAALAEYHRVESLVAANLLAHRPAQMPDEIGDHFGKRLRHQALHSLALTRATMEVTRALQEAGIACILLKGHAVAARYYRSLNARHSIDIDILVAQRDCLHARSVVERLGFSQTSPDFVIPPQCEDTFLALAGDVGYVRPDDGIHVELHWRLQPNPHFLDWDFDTARGFAVEMPLAGTRVAVLEPAPQMVYLVCHGAKHAWFRLKWLADVYRMRMALTPEQQREAVRVARHSGVLRMLSTSLRMLAAVYDTPAEEFAGSAMAPHASRVLLERMLRAFETPAVQKSSLTLADAGRLLQNYHYAMNLRPDLRYRLSVAARLFVDVHDIRTLRLSKKWLWLYGLLGPVLGAARMLKGEIKSRWLPN